MLEDTSADTMAAAAAAATLHLRIRIVGATVDLLRDVPFHEARPEHVAERLDISTYELQQHFPSWDGLVLAAVDRWNGARMDEVTREVGDGSTVDLLRAIVASNAEDPALMRLLVALLSVAGNPEHPMSTYLRSRYQLFFAQVKRGLEHDIAVGRAPHTMDPRRGAEQLIALYEGLQLQALLRSELDLVAAFDRAVARLERGWMERYEAHAQRRLSTWSDVSWSDDDNWSA
ncbi:MULTISPECIES: TetR/AcrR family transcriptional regulator [unclassified Curtobacterium]|uniref:TetR/AcrR family transcriptional regulator n=1 Tax=unclassified Curtobacterium TaxID=257496 RepID=UPI0011B69623|nr:MULTISPECIES: TetR/AcrR family transcriptional regulator [unclassified Curtobacterium]WIB26712.1 TetR/AcrR family transcriptional regulator [Curtobacterium sp. MCSS17_015]